MKQDQLSPEATVSLVPIWKRGISKQDILKSHFKLCIQLNYDTVDTCNFVIDELNPTFEVQNIGSMAFRNASFWKFSFPNTKEGYSCLCTENYTLIQQESFLILQDFGLLAFTTYVRNLSHWTNWSVKWNIPGSHEFQFQTEIVLPIFQKQPIRESEKKSFFFNFFRKLYELMTRALWKWSFIKVSLSAAKLLMF